MITRSKNQNLRIEEQNPSLEPVNVKCDKCERQFSKIAHFDAHICAICKICGKIYESREILKRHEKKCTNDENDDDEEEKEYKSIEIVISCKVCHFSASTHEDFSNHYKDPEKGLKIECMAGGFRVKPKVPANVEKNEIAIEDLKYYCDHCEQKFVKKQHLTDHKDEVHNIIESRKVKCIKCDFTDTTFNDVITS